LASARMNSRLPDGSEAIADNLRSKDLLLKSVIWKCLRKRTNTDDVGRNRPTTLPMDYPESADITWSVIAETRSSDGADEPAGAAAGAAAADVDVCCR